MLFLFCARAGEIAESNQILEIQLDCELFCAVFHVANMYVPHCQLRVCYIRYIDPIFDVIVLNVAVCVTSTFLCVV